MECTAGRSTGERGETADGMIVVAAVSYALGVAPADVAAAASDAATRFRAAWSVSAARWTRRASLARKAPTSPGARAHAPSAAGAAPPSAAGAAPRPRQRPQPLRQRHPRQRPHLRRQPPHRPQPRRQHPQRPAPLRHRPRRSQALGHPPHPPASVSSSASSSASTAASTGIGKQSVWARSAPARAPAASQACQISESRCCSRVSMRTLMRKECRLFSKCVGSKMVRITTRAAPGAARSGRPRLQEGTTDPRRGSRVASQTTCPDGAPRASH